MTDGPPTTRRTTASFRAARIAGGEVERAGKPDQAATNAALACQAVTQARAGADVIGPAAMVPGSIAACRSALDAAGFDQVRIMPHLIVSSRLYGGYRAAMDIRPQSTPRPFQLPVSGSTATAVERG